MVVDNTFGRVSLSVILLYNKNQVKTVGSIDDVEEGNNAWIDVVDPDDKELDNLARKFNLNQEAIQTCSNKSKKPEIRQLGNHTFTVIVDMENKNPETLQVEAIYFFLGRNWLITIHSSEVNLEELVERLFKIKNETITKNAHRNICPVRA